MPLPPHLGHTASVTQWETVNRQPPVIPQPVKPNCRCHHWCPANVLGQHQVAVACQQLSCQVMATVCLSKPSSLGMALLGHDSPWPQMCLLPPITLLNPQLLTDSATRCFFPGWLAPAPLPHSFTWFNHVPCCRPLTLQERHALITVSPPAPHSAQAFAPLQATFSCTLI